METAKDFWEDELRFKAASTQETYRFNLQRFLKFAGWSFEDLFRIQLEDEREALNGDGRSQRRVARRVRECMEELIEEGKSATTATMVYKSVKFFMDANGRNFEIKTKDRPKKVHHGQRIISKEQITKLLDSVSNRNRLRNIAIVLIAKDTGLRVSDLSDLNVKDVLGAERIEVNEETFLELKPYVTKKMKETAYPVLGPESVEAVLKYIGDRTEGPLFIDQTGGRMKRTAMTLLVLRLSKYLDRGYKISAHSLRKYFVTRLQGAEMAEGWIKLLMGKASDEYTQPHMDGSLTKAYIEKYDALRIYGKATTDKRIETLEKDLKEVKDVLVVFQGMVMDDKGLDNRDQLIQVFNQYVTKTIEDNKKKTTLITQDC